MGHPVVVGSGVQDAAFGAVVVAGEVDLAFGQQGADDRERLLEPADAMIEWEAERAVLTLVPPGPEAER